MAFGYIMLAELINAQHGLGYLLMTSQRRGLSEHIILILMIIGTLAYGIDRFLFFIQRGLFPHRPVRGVTRDRRTAVSLHRRIPRRHEALRKTSPPSAT